MTRNLCSRAALVLALGVACTALAGPEQSSPAKSPTIRLHRPEGAKATFDVVGLDAGMLASLAKANRELGQWAELFAVYVDTGRAGSKDQPPVLGSYRVEEGLLRFEPRYPPVAGVRYRAVFNPSQLPNAADPKAGPVVEQFAIPKPPPLAPTAVEQVYPTRDKLPENLLKFYLHFTAPMSRGEAYRHLRLLDAAGKPVASPFLELGEELWDPQGKRFTLFIDPGRIKRGLKPREDLGPVLEAGKRYTLEIDPDWSDAQGNPLKETYRKAFRAVVAAEEPPDPESWKVQPPPAGTLKPLTVTFSAPLDHALLQRLLWLTDALGRKVAGTVTVGEEETRWQLAPERPWQAGAYSLIVDTTLEDLAGNSIGRPFEVDVFRPIEQAVRARTVTRAVVIEPGP